jgi:transcriptional regulator with XRE-family HTH domain
MNMPPRAITPSGFVGPNVRRFREARNWTQQELVERLKELGVRETGWDQPKIHRLESGKRQRVTLEDAFELAMALDVSPLHLMTPMQAYDEAGNLLQVWIGGDFAVDTRDAKQWVRGVKPLLRSNAYKSNEDAVKGRRFFLADSQPLSEWMLIEEAGKQARQARASLAFFESRDEDDGE